MRAPIYEDRRGGRFFGTLKIPVELPGLVRIDATRSEDAIADDVVDALDTLFERP